jgi:hypothetical protein
MIPKDLRSRNLSGECGKIVPEPKGVFRRQSQPCTEERFSMLFKMLWRIKEEGNFLINFMSNT